MNTYTLRKIILSLVLSGLLLLVGVLHAYPLNGSEYSGIQRLIGYQHAQERPAGAKLPPGALLGIEDIQLSLVGHENDPDFDQISVDEKLQLALDSILKNRNKSYGAVVVDMSNPDAIAWAAVRPDVKRNAGSVGKLLIMIGLFDALAKAFPNTEDRARILKETQVLAGDWVITDTHDIPHFNSASGLNSFSKVIPKNIFSLSEWVDHMISPSANAAASVVWREAILLKVFGKDYPVDQETADAFFKNTAKIDLTDISQAVINDPLQTANIKTEDIQQGSFFTHMGKKKIPGITSYATPRELARILFRMEQGRLVDHWSSLEMKRYMYMTKRRYRYVYAPELHDAAVYFKSGSLYQCQPEEGYRCGKYLGNKNNFMNSVAIIEWPKEYADSSRYLVTLMSNVLKQNSAWDHSRLAAAIDKAVRTRNTKIDVLDKGKETDIRGAGQG
jgi:hypothetical protein